MSHENIERKLQTLATAPTETQEIPAADLSKLNETQEVPVLDLTETREFEAVVVKEELKKRKKHLKARLQDEAIFSTIDSIVYGLGEPMLLESLKNPADNEAELLSPIDLAYMLDTKKNSKIHRYTRIKDSEAVKNILNLGGFKIDYTNTKVEEINVYQPYRKYTSHLVVLEKSDKYTQVLIYPSGKTMALAKELLSANQKHLMSRIIESFATGAMERMGKLNEISPYAVKREFLRCFPPEVREILDKHQLLKTQPFLRMYHDCLHDLFPEISDGVTRNLTQLIRFSNSTKNLNGLFGKISEEDCRDAYGEWQITIDLTNRPQEFSLENLQILLTPNEAAKQIHQQSDI